MTIASASPQAGGSRIPCPHLYERYSARQAEAGDGTMRPLAEAIPPAEAEALYKVTRDLEAKTALEVGMATGTSALAIGTALNELGGDRQLISIDPGQSSNWDNIGVTAVRKAGLNHLHRLIEDFDYLVLPELLRQDTRIDFAYIDGWHTFDYVLLDFFYVDKLLRTGGIVGFNDCGWPATHRVLRFLTGHRHYVEIDVGLERRYESRFPVVGSLLKRATGRSDADRYFRKVDDWEPETTVYERF